MLNVRVVSVDVLLELMTRIERQFADAGLSQTELVHSLRQAERTNVTRLVLLREVLKYGDIASDVAVNNIRGSRVELYLPA